MQAPRSVQAEDLDLYMERSVALHDRPIDISPGVDHAAEAT
jgi:hypothetical protein